MGVPNKMFYLLAAGGTHPVTNITVQGIGIEKAISIAFKANMEYWKKKDTKFQDALNGMVEAADDLYGSDSNEVRQVQNAWAAVRVTNLPVIMATVAPSSGGTTIGGGSYAWGATATVTAVADAGYDFVNWTEGNNVVSTSPTYTFIVNGSRSLVPNFASQSGLSITATAGYGGTITPSGVVTVNSGASQTFAIAANPGYHIVDVKVDNVSQGAITSYPFVNVTAKHTIAASFAADSITTFTIAATAGYGGTITPSGAVSINYGAGQTFSIIPNTGYKIVDVSVDNVSQGTITSYPFTNVIADHTINASFASSTTYIITATAGTGGTITPSGAVSISSGASQVFTIASKPGYHIADVSVDGISQGAITSYPFTNVTANHSINASFAANAIGTFTITAMSGPGGTITPLGEVLVSSGAGKTFAMIPNPGYHVVDVQVDGDSQGAITSYPFNNVTADHTINASFSNQPAPSNLQATAVSATQINLSWTDNSANENNYVIERKTGEDGRYAKIAIVGANVTSYASKGLLQNATYFYRVRAYSGDSYSAYTNEADATTLLSATPVVSKIGAGWRHSLALKSDGTLWAWGYNYLGQIGDGSSGPGTDKPTPVQIGMSNTWVSIAAGGNHNVALKSDGILWAWGHNQKGEIGDGSSGNFKPTPVQIGDSNTWISIAAGFEHTVALKSDGTLWAWGANQHGQIGDGSGTNKPTPVKIGDGNTWVSIAATGWHTVALKSDGTLWAWGYNYYGQIGDGSSGDFKNKLTPVQIGDGNTWVSIAAGGFHTVALKSDGTLWAWGENVLGQLGDGTWDSKNVPVQIGTGNTWISIAAGYVHTVALKSDGTLWAWGYNGYGQIGDGSSGPGTDKPTPVQIGDSNTWISIAAGGFHTVALKSDGMVWAWGSNYYGQIGDGSSGPGTDKPTPVPAPIRPSNIPTQPSSLTATAMSANQVNLSWSDMDNEISYMIERKTGTAGTYAQIAIVGGNVTSYASTGLTSNTGYFYRVRGFNGVGYSAYTNEAGATTLSLTVTVVKSGAGNGTVLSNPDGINCGATCGAVFSQDSSVLLTAIPDSGSLFAGWSGDCSGGGNCPLVMNSDKKATAGFTFISCPSLPVRISKGGAYVYYSTLQNAYDAAVNGDIIQSLTMNFAENLNVNRNVSITLAGGYDCGYNSIVDYTGLLGITKSAGTLTISHIEIVSTIPDYTNTLVSVAGPGGSISPSGTVNVYRGASQTYTLAANTGYQLLDVLVDGVSVGAVTTYTFTNITANHTIQAIFSRTLTVTKAGTGAGTITSSPAGLTCGTTACTAPFAYGTVVTLTAAPAAGSIFAGWSGSGCSGTSTCTVTMNTDTTVTATFSMIPPVSDFICSPTSGIETITVNCTDLSTNNPTSWLWDFGDSTTSTLKNPSHTYNTIGAYNVSFTATNIGGSNTSTKTNYIAVQVCPNQPVRIAGATPVFYSTLQAAYDAAGDGAVIQSRNLQFTENLNVNRNISVTLQGGYVCDYSATSGVTNLKGMITKSAGTLTIKNFVLQQ